MTLTRVSTFRVSVTDRCNLRCVYCMPPEGVSLIPHQDILRFEEIERIVRAAVKSGVEKVRITGGEPLVRKDIIDLVEALSRVPGVRDLPMTTNGVLLSGMAADLKKAGLTRVTVSMDTLRPERFEGITGSPGLERVMAGVEAAIGAGLTPVKINVVVVPRMNDDEVMDFARFAASHDLEVRFIERMPMINRALEPHCGPTSEEYIPSRLLLELIEAELGALVPEPSRPEGQPARVYGFAGDRGRVGFIAPMSEPFCQWCARMRLTPDGKLRMCLASDLEVDVRGPIRAGATDRELQDIYMKAVQMKPRQHAACFGQTSRKMSQIGG